ncbi:MAG TPA: RNA polymerase sigma factor [Pirellulales bacterium]|nr:RNA polymerase sigma factor [Pirellulales bacterium]
MPESDSTLPDQALMRRVQAGQTAMFAELVRRYQPALLRVARSRLGRDDWAEDVVQETFLAAFKGRDTYREPYSFRTWLWTILLNKCRRSWSGQSRQPHVICWTDEAAGGDRPPLDEARPANQAEQPLERVLARERVDLLEASLASLPTAQADALRLRFFGGLKFEEIAETMQCSLGTAKNRVRWGLLRLADSVHALRQEDASSPARHEPLRQASKPDGNAASLASVSSLSPTPHRSDRGQAPL